jgi:serine/threonine protein kinase
VLKLLHSWNPLSDAVRRQFFREIQTISSITHPQLASILNYGEWHQQLFVIRTFSEHGSLLDGLGRTWLRQPLDTHTAITYGVQIAKVLNYIHKTGYTHGSLTFSNILIAQKTKIHPTTLPILISDVGLATFVQSQKLQQTSLPSITAAPEQLKGQTIPASDQYALAIMLYIWLTGRSPFSGSPEEIVRLKNQEIIQHISPSNTNVSRGLETVLRKALSAHPKNRYTTIYDFIYALAKTKQPQPTSPSSETTQITPTPLIPIANAKLVITLQGSTEMITYQITQDETTIGRAGSSDILLEDDTNVSRHHALIHKENNQYTIYDCRSTEGISVNDQKLPTETAYLLANNDLILIGNYSLIFYNTPSIQLEAEQQEHIHS